MNNNESCDTRDAQICVTVQTDQYEENGETFIKGIYNQVSILIRKKDGYVNVGKLCQDAGKNLYGFKRGNRYKTILKYWNENENFNKSLPSYELKKGYLKSQGSYFNSDLIHFVVDWISIEYAFKVKRIMNAINEKGQLTNNPNYIDDHLKELLEENKRLKEENEKLRDENKNLKPRAVLNNHKDKYFVIAEKNKDHKILNETKLTFHRVHEEQAGKYKNINTTNKNKDKQIEIEYQSDPKPIAMSYFHEFKTHLEKKHKNMYRFDRDKADRKKPTTIIFHNMILDKALEDLDKLLNEFEN
jgi:regulator of replication initiation timing